MKKIIVLSVVSLGWAPIFTLKALENPLQIKGAQGQILDYSGEIKKIEQDIKMFDASLNRARTMVENVSASLDYHQVELGQGQAKKSFAQKTKEALSLSKPVVAKLPAGILEFNTIATQYKTILDNLFKDDEILQKIIAEKNRLIQLSHDASISSAADKNKISALITVLKSLDDQFDKLSKEWTLLRRTIVDMESVKNAHA